jgi:pimeloyl-ACP methyl ester carboxylesterase
MYMRIVIIIPGLGDELVAPLKLFTSHWPLFGLQPHIFPLQWQNSETFAPKLKRLLKLIADYKERGYEVSLVGTSAGGCAAINAFMEAPEAIDKVINVCGRLRVGPIEGVRSFEAKTATSQAFAESVKLCESRLEGIRSADLKKVTTIHSALFDQLVPPETTTIIGARNIAVPFPEHMFSIGISLLTVVPVLLKQ